MISLATIQAAVPGQSGSGGSETQNFCYDEQNRLVWAGNSGTQPAAGNGTCGSGTLASGLNGASYTTSYVYTHLGQLWQGPLNGGSTQEQYLYCNSQPHELTGLYAMGSTCASKSGQGYATSYDAFGNVTSRTYNTTTATLSYDDQDHFVEWNAGASSQEWYLYDAKGQRVLRRSTSSTGTTLTVYAFGLEEHVYSSSGGNQGNTYYYMLSGHLLGKSNGGSGTFYQTDLLGSVVADWSNTAGSAAILGNEVYGPYGKERYNQGTHGTSIGFTGHYNDSISGVSGLDYYNARYYDPKAGVFLSADTLQGNVQGLDPYSYVGGNPETYTDPSGQIQVPPGDGGGGSGGNGGSPPPCICGQGPQPQPAPGPGGGPVLPNQPDWHQVGSIIAFGYQFGNQILAASVAEAFARHEFAWDDNGASITLDRLIAYLLALTAQSFRNEFQRPPGQQFGFDPSNNVGNGFYYVTDAKGNLVTLGVQDPVVGSGSSNTHSETVLVNSLRDTIPSLKANGQLQAGDTLHYLMYTQLTPCPGSCRKNLLPWARQIAGQAGKGVSLDFNVWTSNVKGDRRQVPVTTTSQIQPFYYYFYDALNNVGGDWMKP